jgi:hypothetical protein
MRARVVTQDEAESNARWRDWKSNDDDGQRRRTLALRTVCLVIAVALSVWALVQFV